MSQELASKHALWPSGEAAVSPEQFAQAYDAFAAQIYRHTLSRVGNKGIAEDLTSQVFLKAWDYLIKSTDPVENIRAFLFRIAHNLITDHYRKRKFETVALDLLPEQHRAIPSTQGVEKHSQERELMREIEHVLNILESDYRDVLVWRYIDELSIEEIVAICGKSPNHIYVLIHRAIKKVRVILAQKGL